MPERASGRPHDLLRRYAAKRDFSRTPEPAAGGPSGAPLRRFVVQKHWAKGLHYDFRLELDGVLKSWAIPKGPSLDPKVKRMAVAVEDHPLAYAAFEGRIPAGLYGAGEVIVWDAGSWVPLHDPGQAYLDGNLKFELRGHKLHGHWVLVRMKGQGEKQEPWLLIKEKDAFARAAAEYSVVDALPESTKALGPPARSATPAKPRRRRARPAGLPVEAVPAALPPTLAPQLATLAAGPPPDAAGWLYEIKFDGYRMLVRSDAAGARLFTRNGQDWTHRLPALRRAFEDLKLPAGWYDGEIVVPNEAGVPDFGALQQSFDLQRTDDVVLYLFDLPYVDGHDLRNVPLEGRRVVLEGLLEQSASEHIRFSAEFDAAPESVWASACRMGLEGVIAKRRSARYRSSRSDDWIKLKCRQRQEFVIGGYTCPRGARGGFGALLLGVHDAQGALQYAGSVGTGFGQQALQDIKKAMDTRSRSRSPFPAGTKFAGKPQWVTPTLVAEVTFAEWTRAGRVRHAVFRGLRCDKAASAIVRETPLRVSQVVEPPGPPARAPRDVSARLHVTNPGRVIDERSGTTKIGMLRYYDLVGDLMLPHLRGRPVSLVRAPAGVGGTLFFQKHAKTGTLPGIRQLDPALGAGSSALLEVVGKPGLLAAAQWNVLEFHTVNSGARSTAYPDRMVFDLDPGEGVTWLRVQEAAQLLHALLGELGLPAFLKTSGGKGLHVVVPVRRVHDWDTVKGFSRALVLHMARTVPQRFVARSGPGNRVGKIFIDYLRNALGATTVCAWSARARPGLGVSVPVAWGELPTLRGGDHWSVASVHERLSTGNGPWKGYARAARGLTSAMASLGYTP
jgi:bifunctional non-homologous end joining protein LigD